jgi:hypothetical protein
MASLPKQLLFNDKVRASYARNFNSNIQPQNTNRADVGQTTIINIPTGANQLLSGADSTLSLNLSLTNATVADTTFDRLNRSGIAGAIQRMRIFHGSTALADVDN